MSLKCYPLLYISMAGEMLYILEQRLKKTIFQHAKPERSNLILSDILAAVFGDLKELFQPKPIPPKSIIKKTFEILAHSSIMKLNETSMDKLFDLMTMTSKYQFLNVAYPEQTLAVTINHLVELRQILSDHDESQALIDKVHTMVKMLYKDTPLWEWIYIKNGLLSYYQGSKVKVSLMMREQRQLDDGTFIVLPVDSVVWIHQQQEPPGRTKYFNGADIIKATDWPVSRAYETILVEDSLQLNEPRSTNLGCNMYKGGATNMQIAGGGGIGKADPIPDGDEMKLLQTMFRMPKQKKTAATEQVSLFDDEDEENTYATSTAEAVAEIKRIDASKNRKSLKTAMKEMKIKEKPPVKKKTKGADILDLMDEEAARPPTAKKTGVKSRPNSIDARPPSAVKDRTPSGSKTTTRERSASVKARPASRDAKPRPPSRTPSATRKKV